MGFIDRRWVPLLTDMPRLLGLGVGCAVLLVLSHQLWPLGDAPIPGISLASGLGLAGLLMGGNRLWPGIGAGMAGGLTLLGVSVAAALGIALGSTVGAVVGGFLVRQRGTDGLRLDGLKDYLALILLGALPATLTSAIFTSLTLSLGGGVLSVSHLPRTLAVVWQGDFLGALLVGPLLLCLRPPWLWPPHLKTRRGQWSITVFFLIALLLLATLSLPVSRVLLHLLSHPYIIYPLVIWAAFSLGRRGTGLLCLLMVSLLEALPQGREILITAPFDEQTLHRWLSGSFICLTGMGMATLFHERRLISASLAKSRQELAASEATFRSLAQSSALMVWNRL